ncbi:DsbA family oxidoreductase [Paenibacillus camerounensis]|uniref:DsbA family oxidoreductase n=1 Tax=Paenibacillus camerounensis TaxID=1243663 RepID=UPI0006936574|nr:DsbA family oxidoreductase [Paenibacillus camerounensis]
MITIDIWTDFVCEYCYIGKRELENALVSTGLKDQVKINYKAFQLMPDAPTTPEQTMLEAYSQHVGKPIHMIHEIISGPIARAKSIGIDIRFDNLMSQSTLKAHRVAKYAQEMGKGELLQDRLFYSLFTENKFLADTEQLVEIAKQVGLDEEAVRKVANDETAYLSEVQNDKNAAAKLGVRGVPYYVFNNQYAVSGAQPQAVFAKLLDQLKEELGMTTPLKTFGENSAACGPEGCSI